MREIPLTKGKVALVDDEDYDGLAQYEWQFYAPGPGYAARFEKGTCFLMHRVIMQASEGELIGHWNGNTLDNRRANLYRATSSNIGAQQRIRTGGKSRFKGVTWDSSNDRWRAVIRVHGKKIHVGYFRDEEEAARAYDAAALRYFGPSAMTNSKGGMFSQE